MIRRPPRSTRTDTLFPYTTLFRSDLSKLPNGYKVVANVPYYITSKIVQRLMTATNKPATAVLLVQKEVAERSEEHTSELQSLMRISYAVFCLKKKKNIRNTTYSITHTTKYIQTHKHKQLMN